MTGDAEPTDGALRWIAKRSPWPLASMCAIALVCIADVATGSSWPRASVLGLLGGLALWFGLVHGGIWSLAFVLFGKLPGRLRIAIWPLLGTAGGVYTGYLLGTFSRLQTRYWKLAANVLIAATIGGLVFGVILSLFQLRGRATPWVLTRSRKLQAGAAVALLAIAVALWFVDRRWYPGQYYYGHVALRLAVLWTGMLAIVAASGGRFGTPGYIWGGAFGGFVACMLTPNAQRLLPPIAARPWPAIVLKVNQKLTDFDGDSYSAFLGGGDCAPWNPRVHPGAREVPGNGIDDNCLLGDAKSGRRIDQDLPIPKTPPPVDVVLITVDSLRTDHLGVYNRDYGPYGLATSPNLDKFANGATVFDHAYTAGAWTSVAVPSLLRGVYPRRLKWKRWFETTHYAVVRKPFQGKLRPGEHIMRMFPLSFDDEHPSVASMLRRRGVYTVAVTDDGHSEMLQPSTGLNDGFVSYREVDNAPPGRNNDIGAADLAISALARIPPNRRFFLWVHFFGIHWPDERHLDVRDYGSDQVALYNHEVAFFDSQCGRLLDAIAKRPHPVAVILAADHGESLVAGIRQHGLTLEEAVIKIPLIVRAPGWPAGHFSNPATALDIVPTILALTETPLPSHLDGVNLFDLATGKYDKPRILFSDTWRYDALERLEINYSAAFDGVHKVILDRMTGSMYEFDQRSEQRPREVSGNPAFTALTRALFGYLEETGGALDLSE